MTAGLDWREQWEGNLYLRFERAGPRTFLQEKNVTMPLAFQKVLYPEGPSVCHGVILHPPGGFAKGDRLNMTIDLEPYAEAVLTTPGAGKFYGSSEGAAQRVHARIEEGAHLEWIPQETILFNGAQMGSSLRVDLAERASWMGWDIWRFGRSGAGENFSRGTWRASTEVWRKGQLLWADRQELVGGTSLLHSPFGLRGLPVLGTFAWIGGVVSDKVLQGCRAVSVAERETGWAVGRVSHGLVARYLGHSTADARHRFAEIWGILRSNLRQRPACWPRVWNT